MHVSSEVKRVVRSLTQVFQGQPQLPGQFSGKPLLLATLALLILLTLLQWGFASRDFGFFHDPVIYLAGAEGIANGQGYRFATHEGLPAIGTYPPAHSVYLSLFWRLQPSFPESVGLLQAAVAFLGALAGVGSILMMHRLGLPFPTAALVGANMVLGMRWSESISWVMSDPGMAAILFGMAAIGLGASGRPSSLRPGYVWLLAGLGLSLAVLWRTAAAGAVAGLAATLFLTHTGSRRWLLPFLCSFPGLVAALVWNSFASAGVSYGTAFAFILQQHGGGAAGYSKLIREQLWELCSGRPILDAVLFPISRLPLALPEALTFASVPLTVTVALTALLLIALAFRGARQQRTLAENCILGACTAYSLLILATPNGAPHVGRYLTPVVPVLIAFAWRGWTACRNPITAGHVHTLLAIGLMLAIPANMKLSWSARSHWNSFHDVSDLKSLAAWAGRELPPGAVIAADWSLPIIHFKHFSGRRVVADHFHVHRSYSPISQTNATPTHVLTSKVGWDQYKPGTGFIRVHASPKGKYEIFSVPPSAIERLHASP